MRTRSKVGTTLVGLLTILATPGAAWAEQGKQKQKPAATKPAAKPPAVKGPCDGRGTALVVRTRSHLLHLCEKGESARSFEVALGSGGVGERTPSNNKTPTGSFSVGKPTEHRRFGPMVPITYRPPGKQKPPPDLNFGIRGPKDELAWAGRLNTLMDWTDGSVILSTKEDIAAVVKWTKEKRPRLAHID